MQGRLNSSRVLQYRRYSILDRYDQKALRGLSRKDKRAAKRAMRKCHGCKLWLLRNQYKLKKDGELYLYCNSCELIKHQARIGMSHTERLVHSAKARAVKKGLPFDLEPSDVVVPSLCPLLGIPLERGRGKMIDASPTIDRIDSTKGYTKDNIWVISAKANRMKSDGTLDDILTMAKNLESRLHADEAQRL